jgi:glycosyltransferase involved in cell wall biosynthesis
MNTDASPSISVVMPVHNGAAYLDAAVGSIVGQTWQDFEFVILDDGSTDDTPAILEGWAARDPRIRLARNPARDGWSASSDRVARLARAPVCARMDADDIAHPERLARQWAVLRDRPDVVLVGTLAEGIDRTGRRVRPRDRWVLLRRTPLPPFAHGTIMFRRAEFVALGGYRLDIEIGEDLDLCRRLSRRGRVVVLVDALYQYRFHAGSATRALLENGTGHALDQLAAAFHGPHAVARDGRRGLRAGRSARARALYYATANVIWAGDAPGTAPLRSLARTGVLSPAALKTGLLAGSALGSPAAVRAAMGFAVQARDRLAGWLLGPRQAVDWQPR